MVCALCLLFGHIERFSGPFAGGDIPHHHHRPTNLTAVFSKGPRIHAYPRVFGHASTADEHLGAIHGFASNGSRKWKLVAWVEGNHIWQEQPVVLGPFLWLAGKRRASQHLPSCCGEYQKFSLQVANDNSAS